MKTTYTVQIFLASSPLEAGSSTIKNEILLGSCWDPVPVRAPNKLPGKIIAELVCMFYEFHVHVHVFIKSTSTGSSEQVHLRAVHVCMLWAAVGVLVKSFPL
jgi:hypothetical protein